jgi:hypothetical protein
MVRHRLSCAYEQQRANGPLLSATEPEGLARSNDLQGPESSELHRTPPNNPRQTPREYRCAALTVHPSASGARGRDGVDLQRTGHSYLHSVVPWIVMLVALAVRGGRAGFGARAAGQRSMPRFTVSFVGLWLACWACLVAI